MYNINTVNALNLTEIRQNILRVTAHDNKSQCATPLRTIAHNSVMVQDVVLLLISFVRLCP